LFKDVQGDSLVVVTLRGFSELNPGAKNRNYLVDERIAENVVGFVTKAREKFSHLSVNNIFRAIPSSEIKTKNTKSAKTSRHQAGFAIDLNGVSKLNENELKDLNAIASEFGLSALINQSKDLPHFSTNPTAQGYSSLQAGVDENKGHFDQLVESTQEGKGGVKTSALKDKKGNVIGVRFERGSNSKADQATFNKLIKELISNAQ
jgi:hypothetical protein